MSFLNEFVKSITGLVFHSESVPQHKAEVNNLFIELYVSIIRRMADVDGEIGEAELHYYQTMETKLFNKDDKKLNWAQVPDLIYHKALKACQERWNHPYSLGEILSLTDGNHSLRKDLFEIACITAGVDHKFVKTERKYLDLIALEFKLTEEEKKYLMKLHHLA